MTTHLCRKLHLNSFEKKKYIQRKIKSLLSGSVAANQLIFKTIKKLTNYYDYKLMAPPPDFVQIMPRWLHGLQLKWFMKGIIYYCNDGPIVVWLISRGDCLIPWTLLPSGIYAGFPFDYQLIGNVIESKFKTSTFQGRHGPETGWFQICSNHKYELNVHGLLSNPMVP